MPLTQLYTYVSLWHALTICHSINELNVAWTITAVSHPGGSHSRCLHLSRFSTSALVQKWQEAPMKENVRAARCWALISLVADLRNFSLGHSSSLFPKSRLTFSASSRTGLTAWSALLGRHGQACPGSLGAEELELSGLYAFTDRVFSGLGKPPGQRF